VDAPPSRQQADACFVGFGRSGSNSLRAFMEAHAAIDWRRDLRMLLRADGDGYPAQAKPFAQAPCGVDFFEWYALGVFRYDLADGEWDHLRYEIPGRTQDPRFRVDPTAACERLQGVLPGTRIILLIREQADWLAASYRAQVANMPPGQGRFSDYLACTEGLIHLQAAQYDRVLELYTDRFGKDRVHLILSEALRQDPDAVLGGLCAFLQVPPLERRLPLQRNAGPLPALVRLHRSLARVPGEPRLARWLGSWVRRRPGGWAAFTGLRALGGPQIGSAQERESLRGRFRESNRRAASLSGLDLAAYGYCV
jgi:hypothetical protein